MVIVYILIAFVAFFVAAKLFKGNHGETGTNSNNHPSFSQISVQSNNKVELKNTQYEPIIKSSSTTDNLNYDLYSFSAKYIETQRMHKNKEIEILITENPVETIISRGYQEPISYEKIPFEEPTDSQKQYYYDLTKSELPLNASKLDATALISRYSSNGDNFYEKDLQSPNPDLVSYATEMGIKFSYYIGKKHLYELIFRTLNLTDKIAFYAFCVFRDKMRDKFNISANLNKSSHYSLFYEFANLQLNNDSFIKSLDRIQGHTLRYFGDYTCPDGVVLTGASKNTIAYTTTMNYLRSKNIVY